MTYALIALISLSSLRMMSNGAKFYSSFWLRKLSIRFRLYSRLVGDVESSTVYIQMQYYIILSKHFAYISFIYTCILYGTPLKFLKTVTQVTDLGMEYSAICYFSHHTDKVYIKARAKIKRTLFSLISARTLTPFIFAKNVQNNYAEDLKGPTKVYKKTL